MTDCKIDGLRKKGSVFLANSPKISRRRPEVPVGGSLDERVMVF